MTRAAEPRPPAVGPRIQFDATTIDLGTVRGGVPVNRTVTFTNAGDGPLRITHLQSSCGCVTVGWYSRVVDPGRTGEIPLRFADGGLSGAFDRTVLGACNDPTQPTWRLRVKGTVLQPIELSSRVAVLRVSDELPRATNTLFITNREPIPLRLGTPQSDHPGLAAEWQALDDGHVFQLRIRNTQPATENGLTATVLLPTSSTNLPALTVTAVTMRQPVVALEPSRIILPPAPMTNALTVRLTVRNYGTNLLGLRGAAVNLKGVRTTCRETEPGRQFEVEMFFPPDVQWPAGVEPQLTIETSHPAFSTITAPIFQRRASAPPRQASPAASGAR